MMPYTELAHGVWYPKGGMYRVAEALTALAVDMGVEFILGKTVERIDVASGSARGLIIEGDYHLAADAVLANADLPYVYQDLLPDAALARKLMNKRYSCSVVSFLWGVDKTYPSLPPHTLFLSDDYRRNFDQIIDDLDIPDNPSLYVHAPTRLDPIMAPAGQDTLLAIVPVGHLDEHDLQDWEERQDRARDAVFRRLRLVGITDLPDHIRFEISFTPLFWRNRYNLVKGATHGLSHNLSQLGYFRPHNRHPIYKNLFFAGASTHPGTGLPTAMISGRLAAARILNEL
jgi:phytoene desaturase